MDQIFSEIGSALGDFVGSPPVQFVLQAIAIYLVVLWLAGAYWAFRDMQHRTENPILPYVAASFVIVFTPIFFPLAIFVYKIIRPHEKIGEVYERNLAEEALLAEVEFDQELSRPARAGSTTSGSSARPAGHASTGSAPTAAAWSGSTGRCARGAARTSSAATCRPPPWPGRPRSRRSPDRSTTPAGSRRRPRAGARPAARAP